MALYHLHVNVIGRSQGKTAVAAAAYRAGERIVNEIDGVIHDYRNKGKSAMKGGQILHNEIMTPKEVPDWARNRATLWNEVEKKENRKNSQFANDFDIALQKELSLQDNIECVKNWIDKNFIERGLVADFCIHDGHKEKGNISNNNIHAHIMSTLRGIGKNEWNPNKAFPHKKEAVDFLDSCRSSWADIVNAKFKELGIDAHIDHRTLEAQGIDREAQQHQGVAATAMQRRGEQPDRARYRGGDTPEPRPTAEQTQAAVNAALEKDPEYIALKAEREEALKEHRQIARALISYDNKPQYEYSAAMLRRMDSERKHSIAAETQRKADFDKELAQVRQMLQPYTDKDIDAAKPRNGQPTPSVSLPKVGIVPSSTAQRRSSTPHTATAEPPKAVSVAPTEQRKERQKPQLTEQQLERLQKEREKKDAEKFIQQWNAPKIKPQIKAETARKKTQPQKPATSIPRPMTQAQKEKIEHFIKDMTLEQWAEFSREPTADKPAAPNSYPAKRYEAAANARDMAVKRYFLDIGDYFIDQGNIAENALQNKAKEEPAPVKNIAKFYNIKNNWQTPADKQTFGTDKPAAEAHNEDLVAKWKREYYAAEAACGRARENVALCNDIERGVKTGQDTRTQTRQVYSELRKDGQNNKTAKSLIEKIDRATSRLLHNSILFEPFRVLRDIYRQYMAEKNGQLAEYKAMQKRIKEQARQAKRDSRKNQRKGQNSRDSGYERGR